jgi:hypothetical protein
MTGRSTPEPDEHAQRGYEQCGQRSRDKYT